MLSFWSDLDSIGLIDQPKMELVSLAKEDNDDGGIDSIAFDLSTYEGRCTLESQLDEMFLFFKDIVKTKLTPTAPKNQGTPLNGML